MKSNTLSHSTYRTTTYKSACWFFPIFSLFERKNYIYSCWYHNHLRGVFNGILIRMRNFITGRFTQAGLISFSSPNISGYFRRTAVFLPIYGTENENSLTSANNVSFDEILCASLKTIKYCLRCP